MRALFLLLTLSMTCFSFLQAQTPGCNDLFFSEYVEGAAGTGNTKCVEIYNPTGSSVNLSTGAYKVLVYTNGSATPNSTILLTGTVAAYSTYVLCHQGATAGFLATANQTTTVLSHNGNDALALVKGTGNTFVDIFGRIGDDPGAAWTSGAISTVDQVLRRKSTVQTGITANPGGTGAGAFVTLGTEWDNFDHADFSGFGTHTSNCFVAGPCSISEMSREDAAGSCDNNGTPYITDDTYSTSISVDFSNAPTTGNLVLEIEGNVIASVAASSLSGGAYGFDNLVLPANGQALVITARFTDAPTCLFTQNLGLNQAPCSSLTPCASLFFSEYVEGTNFNKCIEIFNPTNAAIDLATYGVFLSFNGGTSEVTLPLSGVIPSGGTFVLCDDGAAAEFLQAANQTTTANLWNGNDVILLQDANGVIDAIGQLGNASIYGENVTWRRNFSVTTGDNNPNDVFTSAGWDVYPVNTAWGLGYHSSSCRSLLPPGWNPANIGCASGTVGFSGGQWTLSSNCYEDLSSGIDEHVLAFQEICGDGEIITRICGINGFGFAGLNFRETISANSKQVSLLVQNSQNAHWFIRSTTGGTMQFQSKPRLNRNWLRVVRTGDVFRGYISTNGTTWQLLFQSQIAMPDCMFVGLVTESNVDGATTTANFCNVQVTDFVSLARPFDDGLVATEETLHTSGNSFEQPESTLLFGRNNGSELSIRPNPAVNELEVVVPNNLNAGAMIQIMDMNGRKLYASRIEEGANLMQLDLLSMNLSAGVYTLSIQDGATVLTKRFVKVD